MDEGGSRIRRRVCVHKRNRPSLGIIFAAPTAAELMPRDEEEEEEMVAGSPRRKTGGVQPVQVQPHQLSSPPEFPVPFPTFGRCTNPGLLLRVATERGGDLTVEGMVLETTRFWHFASQVQTVYQLRTSLNVLTLALLSL